VFRGIRIRMGIHVGQPQCRRNPVTGRMDYYGPVVNRSARVSDSAHGGQIVCTEEVQIQLTAALSDGRCKEAVDVRELGRFAYKGISELVTIFQITPNDLLGRLPFPPLRLEEPESKKPTSKTSSSSSGSSSTSPKHHIRKSSLAVMAFSATAEDHSASASSAASSSSSSSSAPSLASSSASAPAPLAIREEDEEEEQKKGIKSEFDCSSEEELDDIEVDEEVEDEEEEEEEDGMTAGGSRHQDLHRFIRNLELEDQQHQ